MSREEQEALERIVEALLVSSPTPVSLDILLKTIELEGVSCSKEDLRQSIASLNCFYEKNQRSFCCIESHKGWKMSTLPPYGRFIRRLQGVEPPPPLPKAALETLAIIAYRQPISKAEIQSLRGVDVQSALQQLAKAQLIAIVGKSKALGRPYLYGTTDYFLSFVGIARLEELPEQARYSRQERQGELSD